MGRPSLYTVELGETICERIATTKLGLEEVLEEIQAADSESPDQSTVYRWLEVELEFREKYSRARLLQADYMADLAVRESFTSRIGVIKKVTVKGPEESWSDNVERSKLIVSTILKRASQLAPKKYGDKLDLNMGGSLNVTNLTEEELAAKLSGFGVIIPPAEG